MTTTNINETMRELAEMNTMMDELKAEIDALKDVVKDYMRANGVDEVLGENGEKATWRTITSNRFDSQSFRRDFSDVYAEYTKKTTSKPQANDSHLTDRTNH